MYTLSTPLSAVRGIGPKLLKLCAQSGITTISQLLLHIPRRYEDRSQEHTVATSPINQVVTLQGSFSQKRKYYKGRRAIVTAYFSDETGRIKTMWFNNSFIYSSIKTDQIYRVSGKISSKNTLVQPTIELAERTALHTGRIVPLYSQLSSIKQGTLRRIMHGIFEQLTIAEPPSIQAQYDGPTLKEALRALHFPEEQAVIQRALRRLAIEELLELLQLAASAKEEWQQLRTNTFADTKNRDTAERALPFQLTSAQKKALAAIGQDLSQPHPMNRILVGDVGSGKTVVAALAALPVLATHHVCFVVPTKILAGQHFATIAELFPDQNVVLWKKESTVPDQSSIIIGTTALNRQLTHINPGLLVYDEQHKFGTRQRSHGYSLEHIPHTLTMTATTIPRTLALTIFSHLSLSVIDELPPGRKATKTWLVPQAKHADSRRWICEQIAEHSWQALIVCPFINQSQSPSHQHIDAVLQKYEEWQQHLTQHNPELTTAVLHSGLSKKQQDSVIQRMFDKKIDILVTTPMVEVGVDLPSASIIAVHSAQQFGLASLHQLRGRVGRSGDQGYCLLYTSGSAATSKKRLTYFTQELSGHTLAQFDLENRGSGDIFGTQQHGFSGLQFGSWTDLDLIETAQDIHKQLGAEWHPTLNIMQHQQPVSTN